MLIINVKSQDQESNSISIICYGAVGDGKTLNTQSIQKAIDACSASGGGTVYIPAGKYLSGTIILKNNVTLFIDKGGVLLGSANINDYPEIISTYRFYGDEWVKQSLIFSENSENIGVTGGGVIDGQGSAFKVTTKQKPDMYRNRPYIIRFIKCRNISVDNISMQNSAMWMQHYLACDYRYIKDWYPTKY